MPSHRVFFSDSDRKRSSIYERIEGSPFKLSLESDEKVASTGFVFVCKLRIAIAT
jgi:hypothetical protein